jgi:hypothetical protein
VLPPRAPPGCSTPGYELFPGVGYYKLHKYGKTWDQARKICKEEGGNLVIINSEEESKVLQHLFALAPNIHGVNHNDFAFIGFHDRFVEGEYLTIFGKSTWFFVISSYVQVYIKIRHSALLFIKVARKSKSGN